MVFGIHHWAFETEGIFFKSVSKNCDFFGNSCQKHGSENLTWEAQNSYFLHKKNKKNRICLDFCKDKTWILRSMGGGPKIAIFCNEIFKKTLFALQKIAIFQKKNMKKTCFFQILDRNIKVLEIDIKLFKNSYFL